MLVPRHRQNACFLGACRASDVSCVVAHTGQSTTGTSCVRDVRMIFTEPVSSEGLVMYASASAALGFAFLATTAAYAAPIGVVCPPFGLSSPYTCVETDGGGSLGSQQFTNVINPQLSFVTSGLAAQTAGSVGGAGGSSSRVSVTAGFGAIHALAAATSDVALRSLGAASARVVMLDSFTVGSTTAAAGTTMIARLTVSLTGSFAGNGEATGEFSATGVGTTRGTVLVGRPTLTFTFDRSYVVGQSVDYRLQFDVLAAAGPGSIGSLADLSNTVNVFADALTPGGFLRSASGFDYSSNTVSPEPPSPIPEPATGLLAVAALVGLLAARCRADRSSVGRQSSLAAGHAVSA